MIRRAGSGFAAGRALLEGLLVPFYPAHAAGLPDVIKAKDGTW